MSPGPRLALARVQGALRRTGTPQRNARPRSVRRLPYLPAMLALFALPSVSSESVCFLNAKAFRKCDGGESIGYWVLGAGLVQGLPMVRKTTLGWWLPSMR